MALLPHLKPDSFRAGEVLNAPETYNLVKNYIMISDVRTRHAIGELVASIEGCPYVIANPRTGKGIQDVNRTWRRVRKATELEDVRLHDLRHTFASRAVDAGLSLIVISKLLGHRHISTTQRYAHLAFADALAASNKIAELMPRH